MNKQTGVNWKLIFGLSLFGLAMAAATISAISSKVEPIFWLVIFIVNAYIIAKQAPGRYFLHGFLVSLVNCVWITGAHVLFYSTYIAHHPEMAEMGKNMPMQNHPRLMMLLTGPVVGVVCGLVQGLFAFIASKLVRRQTMQAA